MANDQMPPVPPAPPLAPLPYDDADDPFTIGDWCGNVNRICKYCDHATLDLQEAWDHFFLRHLKRNEDGTSSITNRTYTVAEIRQMRKEQEEE